MFSVFVFFCFGGGGFSFSFRGFEGQVRWPEGPPHLAVIIFWVLFYLFFVFLGVFVFRNKKVCFSSEKEIFLLIFRCLPLFLPSLSHFPFHSPSLSLSLSLVLFLLSSFLVFFVFLRVFSFSILARFFASVSCKEQHQNITV